MMAWNEQNRQDSVGDNLPPSTLPPGTLPPANAPRFEQVGSLTGQPVPEIYPGQSGQAMRQGPAIVGAVAQPQSALGGNSQVSQQAMAVGSGAPVGPQPLPMPTGTQQDDETGIDDLEWVNRAKRIIGGTRGDPHRQLQLLQQLSVVYLKERYGRSVHADEV